MRLFSSLRPALGVLLAGVLIPVQATTRALPEFTALVAENGPKVVNISTRQGQGLAKGVTGDSPPDRSDDNRLQDFFRHFFGGPGDLGGDLGDELPGGDELSRSLGSGFIISRDGDILTNAHVVEGAEEIIVRTSDRREFVATLVGADKRSDIALLKLDATDLPMVRIGSARDLQVGEWVLAIGSPFGFEHSATAGIVSAKGRNLPSENYVPFIQTDVAINPGNSGGPLFNMDGEVIGVNSQIYSRTGGFMGLSFAIPIEVAMDVSAQLKTKGRVSRGWLGVLIQDVTHDLAPTFGMTQPRGALVAQVLPDSPAAGAGIQVGDVILSYNGKEVPTSSDLPPLVGTTQVGESSRLQVLRKGAPVTLEIRIAELPDEDQSAGARDDKGRALEQGKPNRVGMMVGELPADQREKLGIDRGGVLVELVKEGPAAQAGLAVGDVILMLDQQIVENLSGFNRILESLAAGRAVSVLIQRGEGRMFYALRIPKP